jgi:hypothetical protein
MDFQMNEKHRIHPVDLVVGELYEIIYFGNGEVNDTYPIHSIGILLDSKKIIMKKYHEHKVSVFMRNEVIKDTVIMFDFYPINC